MTKLILDREEAPECPLCGDRMVSRKGKFGKFWGCINFPKCRGHQKEDSDITDDPQNFDYPNDIGDLSQW